MKTTQKLVNSSTAVWKDFKSTIDAFLKEKPTHRVKLKAKRLKRIAPKSQLGMFLMPEDNPHDIYVWPDGFWCLREEFNEKFKRKTITAWSNWERRNGLQLPKSKRTFHPSYVNQHLRAGRTHETETAITSRTCRRTGEAGLTAG